MGVFAQIRRDLRFYRELRKRSTLNILLLDRFFQVCANYRFGHWACHQVKTPVLGTLVRMLYRCTNALVSTRNGTDIRPGAIIGERLEVHTTFGLVVDNNVVIGDDCILNGGVVIGNKANGRGEGVPRIGNNVTLCVGCKAVGDISIGDHAILGANSVVSHDVPPYHIAIGIPAQNKPLRTVQSTTAKVQPAPANPQAFPERTPHQS
jgi:serine O-acetyltransferase